MSDHHADLHFAYRNMSAARGELSRTRINVKNARRQLTKAVEDASVAYEAWRRTVSAYNAALANATPLTVDLPATPEDDDE